GPFERVLANRREQPEPRLSVAAVPLADEALVDERRDRVERPADRLVVRAHRVCDLERAAAAEDAEPREQPLLGRVEQVVAPLDRRSQRPLPLGEVARAAGEETEALAESGEDRLGRE